MFYLQNFLNDYKQPSVFYVQHKNCYIFHCNGFYCFTIEAESYTTITKYLLKKLLHIVWFFVCLIFLAYMLALKHIYATLRIFWIFLFHSINDRTGTIIVSLMLLLWCCENVQNKNVILTHKTYVNIHHSNLAHMIVSVPLKN